VEDLAAPPRPDVAFGERDHCDGVAVCGRELDLVSAGAVDPDHSSHIIGHESLVGEVTPKHHDIVFLVHLERSSPGMRRHQSRPIPWLLADPNRPQLDVPASRSLNQPVYNVLDSERGLLLSYHLALLAQEHEVITKAGPLLLSVANGGEERCLVRTDRMIRREEVVQDLSIIDLSFVPPSHGSPSYHDDRPHVAVRTATASCGSTRVSAIEAPTPSSGGSNRPVCRTGRSTWATEPDATAGLHLAMAQQGDIAVGVDAFAFTGLLLSYWSWDEELVRLTLTRLTAAPHS